MKRKKANSDAGRRAFNGGVDGANNTKAAAKRPVRRPVFRQPKTELEQAIQRYIDLFDFAPIGYVTFDRVGRIEEINFAAVRLLGRSRTQLIGMTFAVCVAKEDIQLFLDHLRKCRSSDGRTVTELRLKRTDGEKIPVLLSTTSTFGLMKDGARLYQTAIVDLTERKHAEESAMRLAAVVQWSHDAIAAKTLNGIITDWNESAERIFGYKPKEIIGKSVLTLIPKDRQSEEQEILRTISRGESLDHYETVRRRKDGKLIDVSLTISPIKGANGEIIGVSKIARDITKQKQTERRLAEQARLLDLSNEAILVRDYRDRITYWNHGAERLYCYSAEEALGKVSHKLLQTKHPEPLEQIYKKLGRDGRWSGELVHRRRDGKEIVVMSHWALDRDKFGRRGNVLETNTDITRRKNAEIALQRSKDLLEKLVTKRTRALRVTNAELKGEIERRKGLEGEILAISDREQQRLGQELHDGLCQHLTAVAFMARSVALRLRNHRVIDAADIEKIAELVNDAATDTRDLSRALHRVDVDAAGLVTALQDLVDRQIWRTPCRLQVRPSFRIDDDMAAAHLYRIAREAVINANKHAQAREIVIKLEKLGQGMALRVIDDGVGCADEAKPKHGLGFHIMNYRAQLVGGRLEIGSSRRGGTCVSCYLPQKKAVQSPNNENAGPGLPAKIAKTLATSI
jgi:PAS domain S-box-containing protein